MKKNHITSAAIVLLALVILAGTILPAAAAPQPAPLMTNPGSTNLVSCWSFDETSGTRNDLYGSNHLTDYNTVGYATGKIGNAADFELNNTEYMGGSNLTLNDSFTAAGWVKLESKSLNQVFFTQWAYSTNNRRWKIAYDVAADRFLFEISTDGTFANRVGVYAGALGSPQLDTWYYIVATYSKGSGLTIRVNQDNANVTNSAASMHTGSSALGVGTFMPIEGAVRDYADGLLDEWILYSRALSSTEAEWLYNSGNGRACSVINPTATPTVTATRTATATVTPTSVPPTATPTITATATLTSIPPTATGTATATLTSIPPTATATGTATATLTSIPPTTTATGTATVTPTITATVPTPTPSNTPEPGPTPIYPNTVTYGDLIQISLLTGLCLAAAVFLIFYILFHTLLRRK